MSKVLADYIYEESDELILSLMTNVEKDGFHAEQNDPGTAVETVMLQVLSQAMVKTLAILCEKVGDRSLGEAYVEMLPLHYAMVTGFEEKLKGAGT